MATATDPMPRLESHLRGALDAAAGAQTCPPRLVAAMRHAVFPGGARIRPKLSLSVALACGDTQPAVADAAAASIELMHCASLVHDDLPCFDDSVLRRGKPSVHAAYGERLAVLTGDALIVLAYDTVTTAAAAQCERLVPLLRILGTAVGAPAGLCAGQAWECEPREAVDLDLYHQSKTGALFAAATEAGAAAAGVPHAPWRSLGARLGAAFQVADDIRDAAGNPDDLGKPVGKDEELDRPSAVRELGLVGAIQRLEVMVTEAADSVPPCPGREPLRRQLVAETRRFLPAGLWGLAA